MRNDYEIMEHRVNMEHCAFENTLKAMEDCISLIEYKEKVRRELSRADIPFDLDAIHEEMAELEDSDRDDTPRYAELEVAAENVDRVTLSPREEKAFHRMIDVAASLEEALSSEMEFC